MERSSVAQRRGVPVTKGALSGRALAAKGAEVPGRALATEDVTASGHDLAAKGSSVPGSVRAAEEPLAPRRVLAAKRASTSGRVLAAKRVIAVAVVVLLCAVPILWLGSGQGQALLAFLADGERVRAWVDEQGTVARLVFIAAVVLQIVVAVLPGGPLEVAGGYAFGTAECAALCLLGSALGTLAVVMLVRTLGMRVVTLFFSPEKIASLRWFRDARRFEAVMFLCFLIPGIPKDILTYVAALSTCPARRIVFLTTLGRTPAVVISALAADFAAQGEWGMAVAVAVVMLVLVAMGAGAYAYARRHAAEGSELR